MSDLQKTQTKKRKVGRPPAKWVYELANLDLPDDQYFDYHDLAEMFGVTIRTMHGFCIKVGLDGTYYKTEKGAVRKRFTFLGLQKAALKYIEKQTGKLFS